MKLHYALLAVFLACTLLTAGGCKKGGGNTNNNGNWDNLVWDQGNWQ